MIGFLNSTDPHFDLYVLIGFIIYFLLPLPLSALLNRIKRCNYITYMDAFTLLSVALLALFVLALPIDVGINLYRSGELRIVSFVFMTLVFWGVIFGLCYFCIYQYRKKHHLNKKDK